MVGSDWMVGVGVGLCVCGGGAVRPGLSVERHFNPLVGTGGLAGCFF